MSTAFPSFDWMDILAFAFFLASWIAYGGFSDSPQRHKKSLIAVTNRYRLQWMREMLKRDNRVVDASMLSSLLHSITFFTNTTLFIMVGLISMLGYRDRLQNIFSDIPFYRPSGSLMWEAKIFLLIVIFIHAFFKYTWALRQYNYCCIFIAAAPKNNAPDVDFEALAKKGAWLIGNAARHFNHALRSYYFGLAALAWFIHPLALVASASLVAYVIHRREFRSGTLKNLEDWP